jgi:hypothetical protein
MPHSTLRGVPAELHLGWKQQAVAHRRSLNQGVILRLEASRGRTASPLDADRRLARIGAIALPTAGMPAVDALPEAEILGLGADGLPG